MRTRFLGLILSGLTALLMACEPPPVSRVTTSVSGDQITYFPSQSGMVWKYLVANEKLDTVPYLVRVEGPLSLDGRVFTGIRFYGRGQDRVYYRTFDERGVQLHAELSDNFYKLVYDNPIQEYPPQKDVIVGKRWNGTTTAVLSEGKLAPRKIRITYQYSIVSKEKFRILEADYDAFLILRDTRVENLDGSGAVSEAQRIRFVPFIGEVQTREGLVLVDYSFRSATPPK
jgi:hypothetical protein